MPQPAALWPSPRKKKYVRSAKHAKTVTAAFQSARNNYDISTWTSSQSQYQLSLVQLENISSMTNDNDNDSSNKKISNEDSLPNPMLLS